MEMVRERETVQTMNAELEAQRHNAQISERYRRLQSAVADQFASETYAEPVQASVSTLERTAVETPAVEQAPETTDFVRENVASSVFTAEKYNSIEVGNGATMSVTTVAPTYVAPVVEQTPTTAVEVGAQTQYSLTPLAKVVMSVFAVVVVGMMSLIGVNSNMISQKKVKIKNLEKQKEQLIDQHEEIQRRIEIAQSEETILQWAQEEGLAQLGK
jgi:cell division protein FtsL